MSWFNYYGLIIMVLLMIPNFICMKVSKESFINLWVHSKIELLEQIGRFGSFVLMVFNIPFIWYGFWFNNGLIAYLVVNGVLLFLYLLIWIIYKNQQNIFRTFALSIIPSLIFIISSIFIALIPLIIFSLIFAPCHILISYNNTRLFLKSKEIK